MKNKSLKILLAFSALLPAAIPAAAHSAIWNALPTRGAAQSSNRVQINFPNRPDLYRKNDFQAFGARSLRGFGKNTKIGFDTFYTKTTLIVRAAEGQARFYANEKSVFRALIRSAFFTPVDHREDINAAETAYDAISKKIAAKFDRRPASRWFDLAGRGDGFAPRPVFLAADHFRVSLKVSLAADWQPGKKRPGAAEYANLATDYRALPVSYTF